MRHAHCLWIVLILFAMALPAFPWGSATDFETHQFILKAAYEELKKDPALKDSGFPSLEQILAKEGVYYLGDGESIWSPSYIGGPGPDRPGVTNDADHYYNPRTGSGNGPNAAAAQFRYLAKGIAAGGSKEAVPKGAAWGAHFMADMSVPYHINGLSKSALEAIYTSAGGAPTAVTLPASQTGELKTLSYHTVFTHGADFKKEADRFLREARKPEYKHMNWFDPWYWNGATSSTKGSSHIEWEMWVFHNWHGNYQQTGYSPDWSNGDPSFENPWDARAARVADIARAAASECRANGQWASDANPALEQSIQDVLTMWRASISALRPSIKYELLPSEPGAGEDADPVFKVEGRVGNLTSHEAAQGVQVRLTILSGGTFDDGDDKPQTLSTFIPAGGESQPVVWKIAVTDKVKGAKVKLEAICPYTTIPDLQYASKVKTLTLPTLDGKYSGEFGGMAGGRITFTVSKGAVSGSFSGTYGGSPANGTFNGTVDAAGRMSTSMTGAIHGTGFDGKPMDFTFTGTITGAISGGGASGKWAGHNEYGDPTGEWSATKR